MRTFAGGDFYGGLGLARFDRGFVRWARAEGHGGGNIGSASYMVHLPDHGVSLSVMVNRFGSGCAGRIVHDVGGIAAWHVRRPSLATIVGSPEGLLAALWLLAGAGAVIFAIRKDRPLLLLVCGGLAIAAGWVMRARGLPLHDVVFPGGALLLALGAYRVLRRRARSG